MTADPGECGAVHAGGAGPTLVLLHGIGGSWHVWQPVIPLLEARCRVIAPTLPGHPGGPPWPPGREATIEALADLLTENLHARGIDRPHLAGNSLGGWLALELARRGVAASVTALSPAGAWRTQKDYLSIASSFRIGHALLPFLIPIVRPLLRFGAFRRLVNRQAMNHGDRVPADAMLAALLSFGGTRILPQLLTAMERDGPIRPLSLKEVPATIAWCADDRVIPFELYGKPMLEAVPEATALVLPSCGHVPMYDDPQAVADTIFATMTRAGALPSR